MSGYPLLSEPLESRNRPMSCIVKYTLVILCVTFCPCVHQARPEAAVADVIGAALPRITYARERRSNSEKKRVRSFGDLGAVVPDMDGSPLRCATSALEPLHWHLGALAACWLAGGRSEGSETGGSDVPPVARPPSLCRCLTVMLRCSVYIFR